MDLKESENKRPKEKKPLNETRRWGQRVSNKNNIEGVLETHEEAETHN